ncbi:MAG: hypothetical protein GY791_04525 [Alphaproteobacteria bacterium]|nr:hypothetical protein [Alphaproteobacteria bacterium]
MRRGSHAVLWRHWLHRNGNTCDADAEDPACLPRNQHGSLNVVTDAAGLLVERLSFDAWGKRREAGWTAMADPLVYQPIVTPRGFTGHIRNRPPRDGVGIGASSSPRCPVAGRAARWWR